MQPNSETTQPVGSELLSDAKGLAATAADRLFNEADSRKGEAVTQVQTLTSTFERAAEGLDESAPAWVKSALEQGIQKAQKFADTLDHSDSRQIANQVNDFARRSPGIFLGVCAAAGFAAARIYKAGTTQNAPTPQDAVSPLSTVEEAHYSNAPAIAENLDPSSRVEPL